ncbi:hypothetical protein [Streptomyces xantholiticus]|uniref:hypothetical protein n=1 Tax=Streptomyces xantholiticus TaxID=68285 RepID=UPI001672DC8C|nr:hypothetical protein [Streptomyces xantholiticus]GGW46049.1 hypothetical protein GCM10010381_34140 [Streptomyces xantholiticus]
MRQFSAPGRRTAIWIAASLAVLASSGCMSVSDDEGRKPASSTSADRGGAAAEPDGGQVLPGGHGRRGEVGGEGASGGLDDKDRSASPSSSGSAPADAKRMRPGRQPAAPQPPVPTGGGASPPAPPQSSATPSEESPEPPSESPSPSESQPSDPPSASSAPEVHMGPRRGAEPLDARSQPAVSPQARPGAADGTDKAGEPDEASPSERWAA